jgi:hypothetical protein
MSRTVAILGIFMLAAALANWATAGDHAAGAELRELGGQVSTLLGQLDSDCFDVRNRAERRLEELVDTPEYGKLLAAEFQRQLVRSDISFEVRWHLLKWRGRLPDASPEPAQQTTPEELDRLIRQLDDDSYGVRLGAGARLEWLAGNPKLVALVAVRLKRVMSDPALSAETARRVEDIWNVARGTWLLSDPADWRLPAVSDRQLGRWLDDLVQDTPSNGKTWPAHRAAKQELMDLLANDKEVPRVKAAVEKRLAGKVDAQAAARLNEILDLTRPAIVVEFWQNRRQTGEQDLLVGVPQQPAGAPRASHFDRIDDHKVHCVSGNTLTPGDYPVGVAFCPQARLDTALYFVNLPTPRRRMAYGYLSKADEGKRLTELSRRTLDRFLAEKCPLGFSEMLVLRQLDVREVSRFAGKYFNLLEDKPWADYFPPDEPAPSSRNGMICQLLASEGTKDAVPGLLDAIKENRFLPPTSAAPYRMSWLAALAIARRDPWPKVDAWLAGVVGRKEPLVEGRPDGPELGAAAAALLLIRHDRKPAEFGIKAVPEETLEGFGVESCRFDSAKSRKRVQSWWEHQAAESPAQKVR